MAVWSRCGPEKKAAAVNQGLSDNHLPTLQDGRASPSRLGPDQPGRRDSAKKAPTGSTKVYPCPKTANRRSPDGEHMKNLFWLRMLTGTDAAEA